jgi:hypothetical protein
MAVSFFHHLKPSSCTIDLHTCCADRKKYGLESKNPIGKTDPEWIFACNCEGKRGGKE